MPHRDTAWAALERWSPTALLAAGGLFSLTAFAFGAEAVTGTGVDVSPAVVFLFLLVAFVGLLGLYPGLAERDATLALGCLCLLAVTAAVLVSTLAVPALVGSVGRSAVLASIVAVAVGSALAVAAFGVASLRTGAHPRPVGALLLVTGAGLSLMVVAVLVYGHSTPAWVSFTVNGLVATSLGASGYVLRPVAVPADGGESADDAVTG